jgi:hypothetical protein
MSVQTFLDSEANRTGLAMWLGTVLVAALQYFALHQTPATADLLGLVIGAIKIWQPDATVTTAQLSGEIAAVKALIAAPGAGTVGAAIADTEALVDAVTNPTAAKAGKL